MWLNVSSKRVYRLLLTIFGVGAGGTALAATEPPGDIFARQFLGDAARMKIPEMVYDPGLQMMVDPVTRQPIYEKNNQMQLAKVTAGCSDCPKYDE